MKKKPANRMKGLLTMSALAVPLVIFAADAPSLELLEFLGDWQADDGEWQDPLDFMQALDALETEAQSAKIEDDQDAQ